MKDLKKTLKISGIIILLAMTINVGSILLDIFLYEFSVYYLIIDSVGLILSLITGIIYLRMQRKPQEKIVKKTKTFLLLTILNTLNNMLIWIITFFTFSIIKSHIRKQVYNNSPLTENQEETNVIDVKDYEILKSQQALVSRLEELKHLRDKRYISEDEYVDLKNKAFKEFIK